MATVTFESLIPEILPLVPECTDLIIIRAIRRASEDFLTKSLVWRVDLEKHFVIAGLADVEIETPTAALRVVQLKKVSINGRAILQASDGEAPDGSGKTFCSLVDFNANIRLTPVPKLTAEMSIRAVLTTTSRSTGLDSAVEQQIHEHLIDGALARLFTMNGMPWADNALAMYHAAIFNAAVQETRGRAENNSGRAVSTISYGGL